MTFKKRLRFLTLKQLVALLKSFLESFILNALIAQDFEKLNIITVLEAKKQSRIQNHFLRYDRVIRCQAKIITMKLFSSYYYLNKHLHFQIYCLRLK